MGVDLVRCLISKGKATPMDGENHGEESFAHSRSSFWV
ncbi:hypothetical protein HHE06_17700 [Helicobacter heilmannii]|nr:hypothetical protein HHE06_17700 [Helicobacter heilmannii]